MRAYDVHCHVLPGVDDGARDEDVSLGLAQQAAEQGIEVIIATPHQVPGEGVGPSAAEVRKLCQELMELPAMQELGVEILPGSEILLTPETPDDLANDRVVTLGDRHTACLLELPMMDYPAFVDDAIFSIQVAGLTPVLAHPERNRVLASEPEKLYELVQRGVLLQVNAGSLLGHYGREAQRTAETLCRCRWMHLLGSDAHSLRRRPMAMKQAVQQVCKLAGEEFADAVVRHNPQRVLEGREIAQEPLPPEAGREGLFSRILRRLTG